MKRIDLKEIEHNVKIGDVCGDIEPNITEDCIFYSDGKPIGFYIRQMPKKAIQLADLANKEFNSKNVPKKNMTRSSAVMRGYEEDGKYGDKDVVRQFSTILGSVPPRPHMRRPYPSISSIHNEKSAIPFIKAMLLLAKESEKIIKEILPEQYELQKKLLSEVPKQWRFADLFTSSISNYNIPASFHRDTGNIQGCCNVIITKRNNCKGGNLNVPDYGATIDQCNNSMLVYPAWRNVHGVTPIRPTFDDGYRNSLVFYPLKAFVGLE